MYSFFDWTNLWNVLLFTQRWKQAVAVEVVPANVPPELSAVFIALKVIGIVVNPVCVINRRAVSPFKVALRCPVFKANPGPLVKVHQACLNKTCNVEWADRQIGKWVESHS